MPRTPPDDRAAPQLADDAAGDAELLAGDRRTAVAAMMARYGDAVFRFAYAMTHDAQVAEEVRQQVFVEAYRDLDRFAGRSSVRSWLLGIARHRCLDASKARRRWTRRFKNEPPVEVAGEREVDHEAERDLDRGRIARLIAACLAKLAPAARSAVVLRYHQDLSYDEAAEVSGDKAGTLQQRVARSLPVLKRCVEAQLKPGESP